MTDFLFHRDSYLRESIAIIREIKDDTVILDRTIFYPTSGGQYHDSGTINGVSVKDVIKEKDKILHVLENPLGAERGETALCRIDWNKRYDNMQQHTAQHLLSAYLKNEFDIETISSHLGKTDSTIDVKTEIDLKSKIASIEDRLLCMINESFDVDILYFTDRIEIEKNSINLRRQPKVEGKIRVVTIGDIDATPCGGTHLRNTSEIGGIKVTKIENYKGMKRIHFLAGNRLFDYLRKLHASAVSVGERLSVSPGKIKDAIEVLISKGNECRKEIRILRKSFTNFFSKALSKQFVLKGDYRIFNFLEEYPEIINLQEVASQISNSYEKSIVIFHEKNEKKNIEKLSILFGIGVNKHVVDFIDKLLTETSSSIEGKLWKNPSSVNISSIKVPKSVIRQVKEKIEEFIESMI